MKHPFIAPLLAFACLASSQTPGEYLRLRHADGITHPVKQEALDTLIGSKICEIDGVVKGSFKISYGARMVQLERPAGDTVVIEADALPAWLSEGDVRVRLIVRATREQEAAPLRLTLLSACTEEIVAADEAASVKKAAAKPKPRGANTASRGGFTRTVYLPQSQLTPFYASFIRRQNPRLSPVEADRIATAILAYSEKYGRIDPRLIVAIIMVESSFDPASTSRSGAMGLGQLMPGTADWMGVRNAYDDLSNIEGCVKLVYTHLKDYYRQTGDWQKSTVLMLAAYNAGEGAVRRHGGVPPYRETMAYIRHVCDNYIRLCGGR
jgi:soluble lytic murein transglycosylase-like protein